MLRSPRASVALVVVVAALFACKKGSSGSGPTAQQTATAEVAPGVVFQKKIRPVGNKRTEEFSSDLAFDVIAKQGGVTVKRVAVKKVERSKRKVEVLSTSDTAIMKVRIDYTEAYTGESQGNREPPKIPMSVSGKSYEAEYSSGKILVKRVGGASVSPSEQKRVASDFDNLGKPDRFSAFIPARPLLPEERFTVREDVVREIFGGSNDDTLKIEQAQFTFKSTAPKEGKTMGSFDVVFKLTGDSKKDQMSMGMDLSGKITLDTATSWPYELSLKGPLTVKGKTSGITLEGTGNAALSLVANYE
jgi:hypothetical protein